MIFKYGFKLILILLIINSSVAQVSSLESKIDNYLSPLLSGNNYSGSVLIQENGSILFSKGYGYANIDLKIKNTPDTKFQIASLSKSFTASMILILSEKGKIRLNEKVSKYLPELSNFKNITIHQLLNHTSGIPDINRQNDYNELIKEKQTPKSLVEVIKDLKPAFNPGEKYAYSNSNYNILARIIEVSSGLNYGVALQRFILKPLNLENTNHRKESNKILKNLALGYVPTGGYKGLEIAPFIDWTVKTGNGSLFSNTKDLLKWMDALMNKKFLNQASLDNMLKNKYAWFTSEKSGEKVIYYNGSSIGYCSYLAYYPNRQLTIVVLGNIDIAISSKIGEGITNIIFGKESKAFINLEPHIINNTFLKEISGKYQFPWYSFEIIADQKKILYRGNYPYYEVSMIPISDDKLFNRFFWTNLVIERNEKGLITHIYWEGNPSQKGVRVSNDN